MASTLHIQDEILPEQILQATLQLYLKHGLKKVTMDDVSKVIGKSRSVLYYYYKNKDEIFDAVMEMLIRNVVAEIKQAVDKARSIQGKIRAFGLVKIKVSEDKQAVFAAMESGMNADEISRHTKTINDIHIQLMNAESDLLKAVFAEGMQKGEIRPLTAMEQDTLIFILLSGIRGIRREMRNKEDFSHLKPTVDVLTAMTMKWLNG
ncbi:transcriptional regulator, TetR family [Chitinophaga costaii]|uniref:Transcriptional regulator, TetR family n=2 Tax=Chitinophaga costaii TaxID=1335309 RepID=A0A1C4CV60_9BACT|nr:TetR/AcrR family transcriptional regulator [Chitinophaga costaii]SCC22943.1 transcriptional regulator, TetR family [Chitinophaga costaii]